MHSLRLFGATLLLVLATAASSLSAQHKADLPPHTGIYGTVVDEDGATLIGANVLATDSLGQTTGTTTDFDGNYSLQIEAGSYRLEVKYAGYATFAQPDLRTLDGKAKRLDVTMKADGAALDEVVVVGYGRKRGLQLPRMSSASKATPGFAGQAMKRYSEPPLDTRGESYQRYSENAFTLPQNAPLSTFGADVDVAAYANVRRFINQGQPVPPDAVRTEEMINYFTYDYPQPTGADPVAFSNELAACPWNPAHQLLRVGVQAREVPTKDLPASNLVFLIDVSGSMQDADKLPLLKQSFKLLVDRLRSVDKVSIVVYAGAAGTVLEPTAGNQRDSIMAALEGLSAGGSTAGGAGILLAYQLAERSFIKGGNNRIILATDGDFNVGTTAKQSLEDLVAEKRESGVALSILGFGKGNYQDDRMQVLAEEGNGNAAYIDNLLEAQKVLVAEFGGTLFTVAKDVKLQVEFNPAYVGAYRLIGYESRLLNAEDFNDDKKDAGDMGSGHRVTALYEIIPADTESAFLPKVEDLKYQSNDKRPDAKPIVNGELATVRMKYKAPDAKISKDKIEVSVPAKPIATPSADFTWAASVAAWSMMLKESELISEDFTYDDLLKLAEGARGRDDKGYRAEALRLMEAASTLTLPELTAEEEKTGLVFPR